MYYARIADLGKVGLAKTKRPEPSRGEVLVRLRACGICGTDIEKLNAETDTPPVLGHELAGEVAALGEGVDGPRVGSRVFVHHHVSCGRCYYCLRGDDTQCPSFRETNVIPGGFSEFFIVPRLNEMRGAIVPLPEALEDDEGVFIEPLACCLKALSKIDFGRESSFCVLGCGSMGLLHIKLLNMMGVSKVTAVDPVEERRKRAVICGAKYGVGPEEGEGVTRKVSEGRGADVVLLATGHPSAFIQSLTLVRKGGVVLLFGAPSKRAGVEMKIGRLFYDEVKIIPSYSTTEPHIRRCIQLLTERRIRVSDLVTHRFMLSQIREAFDVAKGADGCIKVLVTS